MKKVIFETEQTQTVNFDDIKNSDIVGFVDSNNEKGFVSHVGGCSGSDVFQPISITDGSGLPNASYGIRVGYPSVKAALNPVCDVKIKEAYIFPDMKSLLKWFAED